MSVTSDQKSCKEVIVVSLINDARKEQATDITEPKTHGFIASAEAKTATVRIIPQPSRPRETEDSTA